MMMVMELTDGAENEICFRSTHLHPHTEKLEQFMQKLNSESQKSPPKSYITAPIKLPFPGGFRKIQSLVSFGAGQKTQTTDVPG